MTLFATMGLSEKINTWEGFFFVSGHYLAFLAGLRDLVEKKGFK